MNHHVPAASVAPSHSLTPSSKLFAETQMNTDVIDESLREEDPIEFIAQEVQVMDVNAIIK